MVTVQIEENQGTDKLLMLEPDKEFFEDRSDVCFADSLMSLSAKGCAQVSLVNFTGLTRKLEKGTWIG